MSGMLLSCTNWPVIKQVADLLGWIMNIIYNLFDAIGIANIGLCIIVFTIIVRLCMIPMSIKQQKTMKLSSLMNPELQAIQKKYANRKDNDSMMAMNAETKAVYEKYGTSPSGGCLPLLIQMPILLALYGVISAIPTHVQPIGDMYDKAAEYAFESMDEYNELKILNGLMVDNGIAGFEKQDSFKKTLEAYYNADSEVLAKNKDNISNILANYSARVAAGLDSSKDAWDDMKSLKDTASKIATNLKNVSDEDWAKLSSASDLSKYMTDTIEEYKNMSDSDYDSMVKVFDNNYKEMNEIRSEVVGVYSFAGIDLSRTPSQEVALGVWWALLIPVLSALFQWITMSHSSKTQQTNAQDNPMASSMKMMNVMMPLMSAFFCYSFAAGLGLYWVVGSILQLIQQILLNAYFKNMTADDIIKENIAKLNKKRAKQGLPPQKITSVANTSVKNIKVEPKMPTNNVSTSNTSSGVTYKKGGIAAKANMVKDYNDKKNK